MSEQPALRVQQVLEGRYVLQERIGHGRMSSVYRAIDRASGDIEVAVKVLNTMHSDEIKRELFNRETTALKRLSHPNIVRLRDRGWLDAENAFYLVLDYMPYSLDRYLKGELRSQYGSIEPYRVIRELAEAVAHAHSENVIHRDIKPSNILFDLNGRPMLTDFGISKILSHLTVGQTLAGFFSVGYASPEQIATQPTTPMTDIYSLGSVFFHLLTGQEPPYEGPASAMVDKHVAGPRPLKNVLKRMLAVDPADRPSSGAELVAALEVTRRLETLPRYFLILTRTAKRDVVSANYSATEDTQEVADALVEDLGGTELDEVHVHMERGGSGDIIILGDELRLICTPDDSGAALIVKTVQVPYMPNLDAEKGRSIPLRARWEPVEGGRLSSQDSATLAQAVEDLTNLLAELSTHETVGAVRQERQNSRREFIERWDVALSHDRNRIERQALALEYTAVVEEPDYLYFDLTSLPTDNLNWEDDTPLAVKESPRSRLMPVGNFVGRHGRVVEVARQTHQLNIDDSAIPETGLLTVNVMEALAANTRQGFAVRAFRYEQMANPNLANVIIDPSSATPISEADLTYFQDWLSDDKKAAVNKAVSSNDLFLIQGPPGTGKTAVIAEIVLQILRRDPEARILLTSQSNIAVDHALTRTDEAARDVGDSPPEMVRIGRPDKIGHGGESWTLEERARSWRQEVLGRCDPVIAELRQQEREARAAVRETDTSSDSESADAGTLEEWIAEAKDLAGQLEEFEQEYASLGPGASPDTRDVAREMVASVRQKLRGQLGALNDMLPGPIELNDADQKSSLAEIFKAVASFSQVYPEAQDPATRELQRVQELRRVVNQWTRVVGLTDDFQFLIGNSAQVIAATCLYSGKLFRGDGNGTARSPSVNFDWAIVDEAGRATVPEVLVPIVRSDRTILVGDERQLPPMVDQMLNEESGVSSDGHSLETSLFQSLVEQMEGSDHSHLASLRTQYRMHPAIGGLVSTVFYDGILKNGVPKSRRRTFDWMPAPVTWVSTSSLPNRSETRSDESFANTAEADIVLALLERIELRCRERRRRPSVGVITGYSAQVERLTAHIDLADSDRWRNIQVEIATVDSFQGRECDVVIYSTVRSNPNHRIGFLQDYRRINVALSRARELLVIVGDELMMENASVGADPNPFASVLTYIRTHEDDCQIIRAELVRML